MKKRIILPTILAISVLVIGILATNAQAETISSYPPIVQKIADCFNLNVSDVQEVFDDERDERRADMYAHFAERLNDFVTDGKLTEAQKEAILTKHEEMQDELEGLRNLPADERKEKMKALHEEFMKWMTEQGIDSTLKEPFGGGSKNGFRGHMMATSPEGL